MSNNRIIIKMEGGCIVDVKYPDGHKVPVEIRNYTPDDWKFFRPDEIFTDPDMKDARYVKEEWGCDENWDNGTPSLPETASVLMSMLEKSEKKKTWLAKEQRKALCLAINVLCKIEQAGQSLADFLASEEDT
jgi:hypothetical protein